MLKGRNNLSILILFLAVGITSYAQTKIGGKVIDEQGQPIPFANVVFENSSEGTITDENGKFYLQSDNDHEYVIISFMGFKDEKIPLRKPVNLSLKVELEQDQQQLDEVTLYSGNMPKENNPAIDMLRKIWKNKRSNGVSAFEHYQYDKYEKLEFDLNTIDSSLINSNIFNGMEFVFKETDTNRVTGKTYLPIFINESFSKVYGDNVKGRKKEVLLGNKNSGFNNNQNLVAFIKDLYAEYNVYDNYLKFFDKSFVSPLSTTGINVYNYVLSDSAYIDNRWCYNIVYYPRREGELTFKGDFWVNDTTWAIKDINLKMAKDANINWVKDVYIEQEFDVLNDSLFLITRDYFMADFTFRKKEESRGVYGKRTTVYDDYRFNEARSDSFYRSKYEDHKYEIYNRDSTFWDDNRLEELGNDEEQIYSMVDTLKTVKRFKQISDVATVLATNYYEFQGWDFGPVFSILGFNEVEGTRIRLGGRTYTGQNDPWRIQGFLAYGFRDDKFKYGISGKYLLDKNSHSIISGGNRRDVEQLGASLTSTSDVLGRNLASSALVTVGNNFSLSNINLSTLAYSFEPQDDWNLRFQSTYRTLESASDRFSIAYFEDEEQNIIDTSTEQTQASAILRYTPGRKEQGYGVERYIVNEGEFPSLMLSYTKGIKGVFNSEFNFDRLQFYYNQPIQIGGFGEFNGTIEAGKTFGQVPLGLLNVVPGNQTLFSIMGTFPLLDFYEFVTDTYSTVHLEHNFNGRLFSRVPLLSDLDLREIISFRAAYGSISDQNQALNASDAIPILRAPDQEPYWSYSLGVGNIFRVFRLDFHFRGNYLSGPNVRKFGITGSFGFSF